MPGRTDIYKIVWGAQAAIFAVAMLTPGRTSWFLSLAALLWFAVWETSGVISSRQGDTLSEQVWKLLNVRDKRPKNVAFFPLIMGCFAGAAFLFIGLAGSMGVYEMPTWATVCAASSVALGVLLFLVWHFWRGGNQ